MATKPPDPWPTPRPTLVTKALNPVTCTMIEEWHRHRIAYDRSALSDEGKGRHRWLCDVIGGPAGAYGYACHCKCETCKPAAEFAFALPWPTSVHLKNEADVPNSLPPRR